jgi:hypothetical protein
MGRAANDNWPEGQLSFVPHTWRGDSLWSDYQTEVHDRIGATLRAMDADLRQQPLSSRLTKLVHQIGMRLETSRHAG